MRVALYAMAAVPGMQAKITLVKGVLLILEVRLTKFVTSCVYANWNVFNYRNTFLLRFTKKVSSVFVAASKQRCTVVKSTVGNFNVYMRGWFGYAIVFARIYTVWNVVEA